MTGVNSNWIDIGQNIQKERIIRPILPTANVDPEGKFPIKPI